MSGFFVGTPPIFSAPLTLPSFQLKKRSREKITAKFKFLLLFEDDRLAQPLRLINHHVASAFAYCLTGETDVAGGFWEPIPLAWGYRFEVFLTT